MAKNTRRGASRGRSGKQPNRRQVPGWVWLFTGAVAGLFVAFLVHLAHVQLEQGGDRAAPTRRRRRRNHRRSRSGKRPTRTTANPSSTSTRCCPRWK
ncbi:hypothetical protein ASALC70_01711 [Alcanivorax sp. ALC70]|nr:hypothetical protein ASALC70_01711 [Alcanivorax sp. ALC70]